MSPGSDAVGDGGTPQVPGLPEPGPLDREAGLIRLTTLATELLGVPVAVVTRLDAGREGLVALVAPPGPWHDRRELPPEFPFGRRVVETGAPLGIDDVRAHPPGVAAPAIAALGVGAYLGVPVRGRSGAVIGVFAVVDPAARSWRPADRELLELLAESALGIDRRQAEHDLRRSEARKNAILESALDAIVTIDHEGRVLEFNPAAERMFGLRREAMIGQPMADRIVPPQYREAHAAGLRRYLATGEGPVLGRRIEIVAQRADGTEFPVELAIAAVLEADPPLFTAYLRDISERVAAEREIRKSQSLLSQAEQIAHLGSWVWDLRDGSFLGSDELGRILGGTPASTLAPVLARVHPGDSARLIRWIRSGLLPAAATGTRSRPPRAPELEVRVVRPDGDERRVVLRTSLSHDGSGQVIQVFGTAQDVTELKQAVAMLRDREARLRSIVDTAADGVVVIDERGRLESFNPAAERLFGYRADEVLGQNVRLLMPEPDATRHDGYLRHYFETHEARIVGATRELIGLRRDGTTFPLELSVSVVRIGEATRFTGIIRDITERRRDKERLKASNALLEAIRQAQEQFIADTPAAALFSGVLASLLELSGSGYGFVGEVLTDAEGQSYLKTSALTNIAWDDATRRFHDEHAGTGLEFHNLQTLFGRVLVSGEPLIANAPATDPRRGGLPAGHPPLDAFLGLPVRRGGRLLGMIGLANRPGGYEESMIAYLQPLVSTCASLFEGYRTERHREQADRELQASKETAEAANRAKSDFLANISHEVRTPMAAVLGSADLLLDPALPKSERDRSLQAIRRNGEHLMQLIDDVLGLSKIEAEQMELEWVEYEPWQIVSEVVSLLRVRAEDRAVRLEARGVGPIPSRVITDPTRLRQIVVNFVGNAIKFTDADGLVEVRLGVVDGAEPGPPLLSVAVEDQGIGMTPEQLGLIFRPFLQADTSTTRKYGGTGLGLTISRRLAEALGGRIEVRSEPGAGSCFTLLVPIQGAPPRSTWRRAPSLAERAEPQPAAVLRLPPARVLLAEDSPDVQRVIRHHLQRMGLTVTLADNGVEAVELALAGDFDIVLMDMQMPRLDGYGAASSLRQAGYTRPIVALTAHAMREDRDRCLRAGCTDYLTKPMTLATLHDTLRLHLVTPPGDDGVPT